MADKKRGRPKLAPGMKRNINFNLALNAAENEKLIQCSEYFELSKASVLLTGLDMMHSDMRQKQDEEKDNGEF